MDYGTLSVVKRNITVTTGSESRQYNGEELENRKVTVTTGSLPTNFRIKFNPTYSFVHPRSEENSGTIIIYDNNDNIVTDNFNITTVYGTIEVTKADQTCSIINVSNTKYGTNPNGTYDYTCSGPTTNAVHYSSSDDSKITVGNKTYKINVGSGSADIEVYQEGSQDYNASSVAKHTINIATI